MINALSNEVIGACNEYKQPYEEAGSLVIEEQRYEEKVAIAKQTAPSRKMHRRTGTVLPNVTCYNCKTSEYHCEESPESELRKQQWRIGIESKDIQKVILYQSQKILHIDLFMLKFELSVLLGNRYFYWPQNCFVTVILFCGCCLHVVFVVLDVVFSNGIVDYVSDDLVSVASEMDMISLHEACLDPLVGRA